MTRNAVCWCFFLSMARDAPAHFEGTDFTNGSHCFHFAVALSAGDTCFDMSFMSEVYVPLLSMDFIPGDRFFFIPVGFQFFDFRSFGFNGLVAVHAYFHCREGSLGGFVCIFMAVGAVEADFCDMEVMAERDGLVGFGVSEKPVEA